MDFEYGYSCEFLTPKDMLEKNVPQLMAERGFGVFLKVFDDGLDDDYKALLQSLVDNSVYDHFFPWPLLKVEEGYYANVLSVDKFHAQMQRLLDWTASNGFDQPPAVLVDLEPPADPKEAQKAEAVRKVQLEQGIDAANALKAEQVAANPKKSGFDIMSTVGKLIDMIDEHMDEERFNEATRKFDVMVDIMHDYGPKAIAVSLPWTFHDLADKRNLIQDFMACPVLTPKWDMVNYMTFATDLVAGTKGIINHDDFNNLVYLWAQEFQKYHSSKGQQASMCFGITNLGITDVKAVQTDPELYRQEFSAALSAGIRQFGIYALEGVLALDDPAHFFDVVESAQPDFTPDPDRLELARMVFRLIEGVDYIAPVLQYLVKSGKVMQIIQSLGGSLG
ncbi:MAG TPA: hypothetical protein VKK79_09145 [Candidatus Lokiarchaeia archaeon]|nr:hypothetical protein [Candidatus Lokiarchaeia archaeon]